MSLVRRIRFGGTALEGRFEVFNLTNRLNVSGVSSTWGLAETPLPTFMQPTGASAPRRFQISARLTF
jgi:hypothetical protein